MTRAVLAGPALGMVLVVIATGACPSAWAGDIRIHAGRCAGAVHLVVHEAPLSDVLQRLATTLKFELVGATTGDDAFVSVDMTRTPVDLIANLAPLKNVSMTLGHDPRCPQRERIVKVWVLPGGSESEARDATMAQKAREEHTKRTQAGIDMVMNAHGVPAAARPRAVRP
jgi:hypothetical protein